jgi:hypothetical protein
VAASRLLLNDLEILKHLGIRTIGQLLSLPREDLPSRLSATAVTRVQQLQGALEEPIEPLPEADPVAAHWSSDDPAQGLQDMQHLLRHLCEQIAEQVVRRRMACSSVTCQFRCADGSIVPLTASVVKPTQSADLLHEVLCLRIETDATWFTLEDAARHNAGNVHSASNAVDRELNLDELRGQLASLQFQPVQSVSMVASVSPVPVARQRDLFSADEHIVPQEELATLITRLNSRLGTNAVLTVQDHADPRPEFSVLAQPVLPVDSGAGRHSQLDATLQKLTEPEDAGSYKPAEIQPRPLRLLATPQPIPGSEASRRFPTQVMVGGSLFMLSEFSLPERLQTAWWTDHPCHRDYYQVLTRNGSRLWLFRDLHSSQWFVHGIFD